MEPSPRTFESTRPLENRHALVTGAGRGIGVSIVRRLAAMGASITLVGRTPEALHTMADELSAHHLQPFHAVPADVTDEAQVERAFAEAREALGPVDVLVNGAGASKTRLFPELPSDLWARLLDVNVMGVTHTTRRALPDMTERGWGRIVNVASMAGLTPVAYMTAYTASKHAVVGFTRALALEVARQGVTVNAVCPNYVDTDMVEGTFQDLAEALGRPLEVVRTMLMRNVPMGRLITPEEVASAVCWLCHPEQAMVTGHALVISGGAVT
jgi:NAD(P)-dependent dehydrogenase (short-subunit alcohol dehydrogenase family)